MTEPLTIAELRKNNRETVRVSIGEYKGHTLLGAWVFTPSPNGGGLRPTSKGLSVNVQMLPELRRAIEQAENKARELGLLSDGGDDAA